MSTTKEPPAPPAEAPLPKPEPIAVYLRFEEDADTEKHSAMRATLPARWVHRETLRKVLDMFFDSYESKHPAGAKETRAAAKLWGDASRKKLDLDAKITPLLALEETLWVRTRDDDAIQAYFDAKPVVRQSKLLRLTEGASDDATGDASAELTEYVPRVLVKKETMTLEEMRALNQKRLVTRATQLVDLFAVPSDDGIVAECRRVANDDGGYGGPEEVLIAKCGRGVFELSTVREHRDEGRYADAIGRVWNQLSGLLPDDVVTGGYVPLRREFGKVVGDMHGRKWVTRPFFEGDPCGDPAVLGRVLGLCHRAVLRTRAHEQACELMELKARPFDERFPEDYKWAQGIFESVETSDCEEVLSSAGKVAKIASRHQQLIDDAATLATIQAQPLIWTHSRFRSRHVRRNAKTRRCRVDGCEMGQIHCRLADLYHFFVWDETKDGLLAGKAAFPVALRAYAQHSEWPFSPVEARLLPAVLYFKACLELATVLDELMRIDEKPLYMLKARKARVEAESYRGTGAPRFGTKDARLKLLHRRRRGCLLAVAAVEKHADFIVEACSDANPKFLTAAANHIQLMLPAAEGAAVEDPAAVEAAEEKLVEEKAAAKGGGFWGTFAAKAEVHGGKLGARSKKKQLGELTEGCYEDILEGRLEEGAKLVAQYELAKGPSAGEGTVVASAGAASALAYGRAVAGVVLRLARDAKRSAHVAEHMRSLIPKLVVLDSVDALVEGELEAHLERHQCEPRVDVAAWTARAERDGLHESLHRPNRGQVAAAASHCVAWRYCLDSGAPHLLVLEDDADLAPGVHEAVALALAELPHDYDLLYLHVPPRFFRDDDDVRSFDDATGAERAHVNCAYDTWSLTAYVVSKKGAGRLLDLAIRGLDAPLGTIVNREALAGNLEAYTPRGAPAVASRGTLALATKRETQDQFFASNVLLTPAWVDPLDRDGAPTAEQLEDDDDDDDIAIQDVVIDDGDSSDDDADGRE